MKFFTALAAALLAVVVMIAPAEARSVARSRQVVRGHAAAAQVVAAPVCVKQVVAVQPQAQFLYPAPQQVFLPQVSQVYAAPQIVAAPQVLVQPPAQKVVVQPQVVYGAQAQVVAAPAHGRQVVRSRQVVRGSAAPVVVGSQALVMPY